MNCLNKQQLQPDDKCMIIIPLVKEVHVQANLKKEFEILHYQKFT